MRPCRRSGSRVQACMVAVASVVLWASCSCSKKEELGSKSESSERDANESAWGILGPMAENMGPGSRFQEFLAALKAETSTQARSGWGWHLFSIEQATLSPTARFQFSVVGDGKFFSEMAVSEVNRRLYLEVMFRDDPLSDLQKAVENRNQRVMQAARAMAFDDHELKRLRAILGFLPMARESSIEKAMWDVVSGLPSEVQRKFKAAWRYRAGGALSIRDKAVPQGVGPAIGFPLSSKHIADVAFCATNSLVFYKGEPNEFGPWWTVALWPLSDESITQSGDAEQGTQMKFLPWPRLTLAEVDAIIERSH